MNLARISPWLFVAGAFTLATILEPISSAQQRHQAKSAMELLLGDGRKLFANHFFTKADVYFHNGYYPSIFDQLPKKTQSHVAEAAEQDEHAGETPEEHAKHAGEKHEEHGGHDHEKEHEREVDFLGESRDFIEAFGRNFFVSKHTHMQNADARELLPWFKIAAELDPNRIETYTVTSYWLRTVLKKTDEAEEFLRQGWRENPSSYAIIFELGRLYYTDRHDAERARNLWELALRYWDAQEKAKPEPDLEARQQLVAHLADLEEKQGNLAKSVYYLEELVPLTPYPDMVKKQIEERKLKLKQP